MKYNSKIIITSLVETSKDLQKDAMRFKSSMPIVAESMQSRATGIEHTITLLKPIIEDREKEIRIKRIIIYTLFLWFIFSIIYIVSLKKDIVILQDYTDTIEAVDYNSPQD